jgi:hypothetical protein
MADQDKIHETGEDTGLGQGAEAMAALGQTPDNTVETKPTPEQYAAEYAEATDDLIARAGSVAPEYRLGSDRQGIELDSTDAFRSAGKGSDVLRAVTRGDGSEPNRATLTRLNVDSGFSEAPDSVTGEYTFTQDPLDSQQTGTTTLIGAENGNPEFRPGVSGVDIATAAADTASIIATVRAAVEQAEARQQTAQEK